MRISVIMIFLDPGRFFREAIESVLAQTFDDWELLLVDDGSTDGSTEVAREYAGQHPGKIRYLEHPGHRNRGMSASRNLGIAHARGGYISFLDADDVYYPDALGRQVASLDARPEAGMAYGMTLFWYGWNGDDAGAGRDHVDFGEGRGPKPGTLLGRLGLIACFLADPAVTPCMCSLVVRKEVLDAIGGFEESFRGLYEDQVFYSKVSLLAPIFVTGECWSKYRQHPYSSCAVGRDTGLHFRARERFLDWLEGHLAAHGVADPVLWSGLRDQRLKLWKRWWVHRHPRLARVAGGLVVRLAWPGRTSLASGWRRGASPAMQRPDYAGRGTAGR